MVVTMATPTATSQAPPQQRRLLGLPILSGVLPLGQAGFAPEIIAGLTLAALGIPEVMGYARIAQMPVVTGLYTILIPIAVFAVIGSSRHLVVGADSATAAILAAGLAGMAAVGSPQYVALAGMLALITAGILVVARLLRLGFIADFLSRSVLIGFLTGVGIQVAMGQLAGMLGVSAGSGGTIRKFLNTLEAIPDASGATVVTSLCVLGVILGLKLVSKRIPGALIAVVGSIAASWIFDLASHGVSDLGEVPGGLPSFGFPSVPFGDVPPLVATAVSIFIVILAQSAATSRAYAARYQEHLDENDDMVGLGLANLSAGLSGTFVVNGSPTKTQIADSAGGRSQLATLTTAGVVLIVLLFLTGPLQYLPNCVLASVVFLIGVELVDGLGLKRIRASGHMLEFGIAVITAATVVGWGVEQGIILAIVISVIAHLRRSYNPRNAVLGGAGRHDWQAVPIDHVPQVDPGLIVYRWGASLYFANAARFEEQVTALAATESAAGSWICIDGVAMGDVDYTGGETLLETISQLKEHGVRLVFSGVGEAVRKELDQSGVTAAVGEDGFFADVEAVREAHGAKAP
jgi:high affinity sulfate transporter 1